MHGSRRSIALEPRHDMSVYDRYFFSVRAGIELSEHGGESHGPSLDLVQP